MSLKLSVITILAVLVFIFMIEPLIIGLDLMHPLYYNFHDILCNVALSAFTLSMFIILIE